MATCTFRARVAGLLGLPISFFFFFLSYSLSLWVPWGGGGRERPLAALGVHLCNSGSKRKAWDWPGLGYSPPSGVGGARGQPLFPAPTESYEVGRGSSRQQREVSLSAERGKDAGQMVTKGLPWWVSRRVPTVRFAIRGRCWQRKRQHGKKNMMSLGNEDDSF